MRLLALLPLAAVASAAASRAARSAGALSQSGALSSGAGALSGALSSGLQSGLLSGASLQSGLHSGLRSVSLRGSQSVPASRDWEHPGVLLSSAQLSFVRSALAAGTEPFASAHAKASGSRLADLDWAPLGPPSSGTIECGERENPNRGCSKEHEDALAAYTHALLFALGGGAAHARAAARIMDAYSGLRGYAGYNAPLQAAWSASKWSRAAELVVHAAGGGAAVWPRAHADAFRDMLRRAALPLIANETNSNGNWALSMIEGMLGVAVLTEDAALFDRAVRFWRTRVPAYIYVAADGDEPVPRPRRPGGQGPDARSGWYGQAVFDKSVEGVSQETCRDLEHTQMGLAAALNAAETARIQGVDLFGEEAARLAAGLELHAKLLDGAQPPRAICGGSVNDADSSYPTFELGYTRLRSEQRPMKNTRKHVKEVVRELNKQYNGWMMAWETLTHATP
jgi:hypothetical protein